MRDNRERLRDIQLGESLLKWHILPNHLVNAVKHYYYS